MKLMACYMDGIMAYYDFISQNGHDEFTYSIFSPCVIDFYILFSSVMTQESPLNYIQQIVFCFINSEGNNLKDFNYYVTV